MDLPNVISLYIKLLNRQIHIHNIFNLINTKEIGTSILVLEQKLAASPHKEYIVIDNFNLYYKLWKEPEASITHIEKSQKLLLVMQK